MSVDSKKPDQQPKRSDRRTSSRYRSIPFLKAEILDPESGTPVKARLGDLSQGGCSIETDYVLPLGTEVTVMLSKDRDQVKARARVVRASPNEGMGLAFTAMGAEEFRLLDSWLSTFVATSWVAANRRKSQRVAMKIEVMVSGYNAEGTRFKEDTHTIEISALGGLVILKTAVKRGQKLVLSNPKTKVAVECMVAYHETKAAVSHVGLAFVVLNQPFWPVEFPPADWSHH